MIQVMTARKSARAMTLGGVSGLAAESLFREGLVHGGADRGQASFEAVGFANLLKMKLSVFQQDSMFSGFGAACQGRVSKPR